MTALRQAAYGCYILSTMAGLVRIFWPENGFKPVINAVLVLYIITAALQTLQGADWAGLAAELARTAQTPAASAPEVDAYRQFLAEDAAADALRQVLAASGVDAAISRQEEGWLVTLVHPADRQKAETLLAANCGQLPYTIVTGGDAP